MGMVLNGPEHAVHAGIFTKAVEGLEQRILAALDNWKRQRDAWQQFHRTAAGRHVPRRAWMRHGAMLETLGRRHG